MKPAQHAEAPAPRLLPVDTRVPGRVETATFGLG
jgi:hypothetical protein